MVCVFIMTCACVSVHERVHMCVCMHVNYILIHVSLNIEAM